MGSMLILICVITIASISFGIYKLINYLDSTEREDAQSNKGTKNYSHPDHDNLGEFKKAAMSKSFSNLTSALYVLIKWANNYQNNCSLDESLESLRSSEFEQRHLQQRLKSVRSELDWALNVDVDKPSLVLAVRSICSSVRLGSLSESIIEQIVSEYQTDEDLANYGEAKLIEHELCE